MDNIKILEFYNKIFSDPALKSELTEKAKKIKNKEDLKKFIRTEIIPRAKENGFSFSEEDLFKHEYEALRKLKLEDLYNVSGGASFKSILMSGGILSALFLSAGLTSGQIADAVIDLQDVKESGAAMERAIINSVQQNAQPQANNPQNGAQTGDDDDNGSNNSNEPNGNDNNNYSHDPDIFAFATVMQDIINGSPSFNGNDADNDNNNHNISGNADVNDNDNNNNAGNGANTPNNDNNNNNDISVPLPKDVIENSINDNRLKIAQYSNIDIIYILTACNLFVPFIDRNYSGVIDKQRFECGYIQGVSMGAPGGDGVDAAEYNKYYGRGYPSLMTTLFPSSGGILNIAGGYPGSHPLYKICQPTPESMGKIIAYIHNHVRCPDSAHAEAVSKELEGLILYDEYSHFLNIRKNFYDENGSFKKPKGGYKNYIEYLREIDSDIVAEVENERNNTRPNKATLDFPKSLSEEKQYKKGKKVQWQLWDDATAAKLISKFDDKYKNVDKNLTTKGKALEAKKSFLKKFLQLDLGKSATGQQTDVYLHLLYECTYAINNQEKTGNEKYDSEHERFLLKYAVEHAIVAFFIHLGSKPQHIYEFYCPIVHLCQKYNTIATNPDDNKDIHVILAKMENFKKLLETIKENSNSPYKSATREHDKAYHIVKDDQGNIYFSNDTFMDCVDIADRHVLNLIVYDKSSQKILLDDSEEKIKIQELSQKFVDKDVPIVDLLPPNMQQEEFDSILDKFVDHSLGLSIDEKLAYLTNERLRPWHRIFGEEVLNSKREIIRLITDNVKVIVPAIEGHTSIKDLSKKEWLLHFYMHQALDPKGADAVDIVTRTFWEIVVSHMDKDVPEGFFPIKYVETNKVPGNELEPGFLNSLKLLYNLGYALKSDNPSLKAAHTAINALENVCKNPQPANKPDETKDTDEAKKKTDEEILQDALKATLGLFYSAESIEIEVKSFPFKSNDDCIGTVKVIKKITEKETLSFSIMQGTGHARVTFEPVVFNKLDNDLKKFVETEPSLQPFAYKFRKELGLNIDLKDENYKKSVKPFYWTVFDLKRPQWQNIGWDMEKFVPLEIRKTQFFQNYEALRFLRTMQGEGQNIERIGQELTPGCVEANIKINNKKKFLNTFIYENYASRLGSNSSFDFLQNWGKSRIIKDNCITESFSEEAIDLARNIKIVAKDSNGIEYLYTRPRSATDNKEVLIFPLNLDPLDTWTIPATVKINGEEFTVVGTPESCKINVKNIIMSPKIEKFAFESRFPLTESINFENAQNLQSLTFGSDSFRNGSLKEVIVPDSVTELSVEEQAFSRCKSLESFIFPDNITDLSTGKYSFYICESLKQIKLPANLKTLDIKNSTFKNCISLQEFIIPRGVTAASFEKGTFNGCTSLTKLEIPDTATELSIETDTFIDCDAFEIVVIPNSVTKLSIPWDALLGYTSSKKVEIPSSVVSLTLYYLESWKIRKLLDERYNGIIKIKIPEHVKDLTIENQAFYRSKLKSFEVPKNVQNVIIDKKAFYQCDLLSEVVINASNLKLENPAFYLCKALKKIIGPPNVNKDGLRRLESDHIEYIINENNNNNHNEINSSEDSEQINNITDENNTVETTTDDNANAEQTNHGQQNEISDQTSNNDPNEDKNESNDSLNNGSNQAQDNEIQHTHNGEILNVNNEGYVSRIKRWVGSAISKVWNFIKSIPNFWGLGR